MRVIVPIFCFWLLLSGIVASAQGAIADYRLAPEDSITVTVLKHAEFSGDYLIPPDGKVNFPAVGEIVVTGKSIPELTAILTKQLTERLQKPEVTITLRTARMQRVYVLGSVEKPAIYDIKANWRIAEALAAAGGMVGKPADFIVTLVRANTGKQQTFPVIDVLTAKPSANLPLEAGDVISVEPVRAVRVMVTGKVKTPGFYDLKDGEGVLEALTLAGGPVDLAEESTVVLTQAGTGAVQRIAVTTVYAADAKARIALKAGDALTIETTPLLPIYVTGAVKTSGLLEVRAGLGVREAIAQAGGLSLPVDEVRVALLRGTAPARPVKMTAEGFEQLPVQRGDVIQVTPMRAVRVMVTGKVKTPGFYDLKAGEGLLEALTLAGGPTGQLEDSTLTLAQAATGKAVALTVQAVYGATPDARVPLATGDIITVDTPEMLTIYLTGAVKQPGMREVRAGAGVLEALAEAGGITELGDEVRVLLLRGDAPARVVETRGVPTRVPLQRGDVITVQPLRDTRVMVAGKVKTPGYYALREGEGVVEALMLAGGTLPESALRRVKIVRATGAMEEINIAPALVDGKVEANIKLAAGDLVIVPESNASVAVLGYVNRPGFFPLREGQAVTLADVVGMANGAEVKRGGLKFVALLRNDAEGKQQRIVVDLGKFFADGDTKSNPQIQAGDVVYVPETNRVDWSFIFQTISSVALVHNVLK